jgi:tetratricopeptide (TPR) repeat protein
MKKEKVVSCGGWRMQHRDEVLRTLQTQSQQLVGVYVPKETFSHFSHPNNRMLVAVTCLRTGYTDIAYLLFETIVQEGPKQNANHHFAYVRSLVEMAEIDAERGKYEQAADTMAEALAEYPEALGYMMSRIHLEVYITYYLYQAGYQEQAREQLALICQREQKRFAELPLPDAQSWIGPGLCYAIHQWALFDAMEGNWQKAVERVKEMLPFAAATDVVGLRTADEMLAEGRVEQAFTQLIDAIQYRDGK